MSRLTSSRFGTARYFISVDAAERQATRFSNSCSRELRLYFVHALLHLAGLDDLTEEGFKKMADLQEYIVAAVEAEISQ